MKCKTQVIEYSVAHCQFPGIWFVLRAEDFKRSGQIGRSFAQPVIDLRTGNNP
jgi:hypothetical protein